MDAIGFFTYHSAFVGRPTVWSAQLFGATKVMAYTLTEGTGLPVNAKEVLDYRKGIFTLGGITGVLALPVWAHVAGTAKSQVGQNGFYVSAELVWWFVLALVLTLTAFGAAIVALEDEVSQGVAVLRRPVPQLKDDAFTRGRGESARRFT